MNKSNYVITHLHTAFGSVGDSIITNDKLIEKLKLLRMDSVCITDHGSLSNMYSFYYDCVKNHIKPIIGCEVYITNDRLVKSRDCKVYHLILIAKNTTGMKNLLKIVSDSAINGIYNKKPRTDLKFVKKHSEGLICTTACVGGYAPSLICKNKIEVAEKHILTLRKIFNDDLYLEIQPGNFEEQAIVNQQMIKFHMKHNIKLLASNDVHYINKEEWLIHDIHIKSCNTYKEEDNLTFDIENIRYPDKCYYMMSYSELLNSFDDSIYDKEVIMRAIENTNELSNKCNVTFENKDKLKIPEYECPNNYTAKSYLEYLCFRKLEKIKSKVNLNQYINRIYYELDTIDKLGYSSYFLIIRDIVLTAQKNNIEVGPGRGSASGSLVAYLIGITKIDSIKHNLLFERFISIHRKSSFPDIDIDFEDRDMMFEYVLSKYKKYNCCSISTYGMRKTKSSIRAVGRVLQIPLKEIDSICSYIDTDYYLENDEDKKRDYTITESLNNYTELIDYQKKYPKLFEYSKRLEGLPANRSTHAAGTIISDSNLLDAVPLAKQSKENKLLYLSSLDLTSLENLNLIKYDFLKINTLKVIKKIKEKTNDIFDFEFNNYDDLKVWKIIGSKETTGLFQIGTPTYKARMHRFKPKNLEELAQCLALFRTPCISTKLDKKFMDIRDGKEEIESIHPIYDSVTKNTNGIILFQEQIMEYCFKIGLPLHEGYSLIKASAHKDIDAIKKYKDTLWDLSKDKMSLDTFNKIFKIIHDSGKYTFNKSHATSYAALVFETAYYKAYYLKEFLALSITQTIENNTDSKAELLNEYIREAKKIRIEFLPLDIKKSKWNFLVENGNIRVGYCALKNFSIKAYMELEFRISQFDSDLSYIENIYRFIPAKDCDKKKVVALIYSGALGDREEVYDEYFELRKEQPYGDLKYSFGKTHVNIDMNNTYLEKAMYDVVFDSPIRDELPELNLDELCNEEKYITEGYIDKVQVVKDKYNNDMAFLDIQTSDGNQSYVMFYSLYNQKRNKLLLDSKVKFSAIKQLRSSHRLLDIT